MYCYILIWTTSPRGEHARSYKGSRGEEKKHTSAKAPTAIAVASLYTFPFPRYGCEAQNPNKAVQPVRSGQRQTDKQRKQNIERGELQRIPIANKQRNKTVGKKKVSLLSTAGHNGTWSETAVKKKAVFVCLFCTVGYKCGYRSRHNVDGRILFGDISLLLFFMKQGVVYMWFSRLFCCCCCCLWVMHVETRGHRDFRRCSCNRRSLPAFFFPPSTAGVLTLSAANMCRRARVRPLLALRGSLLSFSKVLFVCSGILLENK